MNQLEKPLEWRLVRAFVRCYAMVLLIFLIQSVLSPGIFLLLTERETINREMPTAYIVSEIGSVVFFATVIVVLWRFSNTIANRITGISPAAQAVPDRNQSDGQSKSDGLQIPFDFGVALAGLIVFVEGFKWLAGEGAVWFFLDRGQPAVSPKYTNIRTVAVGVAEALLGLLLFFGAKNLVRAMSRLRGMQSERSEKEEDDNPPADTNMPSVT